MKKFTYLGLLVCLVLCVFSCKEMEEHLMPPEAKEATDVNSNGFTAQWCKAHGASGYLLYVSEHNDFSTYLADHEGKYVEGMSYNVEYLEPDTKYYYYVKAVMGDMTSEGSNHIEVHTLKEHQLPAPMLYEAEDVYACSFKLKWNLVTHAEAYILDVAYDEHFNNYVEGYEHKELYELHHVMADMHENKDYYCRVKAVNGDKISTWSNVVHVKTPEKVCKVSSLYLSGKTWDGMNDNGIPLSEHTADMKLQYNSYGKVSGMVAEIWHSGDEVNGGNKKVQISYFHDEHGHLTKWCVGDIHYTINHDEHGKVKEVYKKKDNGDIIGVAEYEYVSDDKFYERYYDEYGVMTYKKTYYLDHLGNIVQIHYYKEGVLKSKKYYVYDGYRYPKDYQYVGQIIEKKCIPSSKFPVWHEQQCNVAKYSKEVYSENNGWEVIEQCDFEYQYNENRFPVSRVGSGYDRDGNAFNCDMTYSFKSCK